MKLIRNLFLVCGGKNYKISSLYQAYIAANNPTVTALLKQNRDMIGGILQQPDASHSEIMTSIMAELNKDPDTNSPLTSMLENINPSLFPSLRGYLVNAYNKGQI